MAHYEDLIKKTYVANHPLIGGKRELARERAVQRLMAQAREKPDLYDDFSQAAEENEDLLDGGDQKLSTLVYKASLAVQELLGQFNFPLMPKLSYLNAYKVKRAAVNEDKVVSAEIRLEARIETLTGAIRHLEVPVHVVKGSIIPPSVVYYDGKECLLTQTFVDNMIHSATSYALDPLQPGWHHAPMSKEELGYTIDVRNERGYQPRENYMNYLNYKKMSKRRKGQEFDREFTTEEFDKSQNEIKAYFEEEYDISNFDLLLNAIRVFDKDYLVSVTYDIVTPESAEDNDLAEYGFEMKPTLVSGWDAVSYAEGMDHEGADWWYSVDPDHNYQTGEETSHATHIKNADGSSLDAETDKLFDLAINESLGLPLNELRGLIEDEGDKIDILLKNTPDPRQMKLFGKRRRALRGGTPSGWQQVVDLMEKAKKDGTDTFPRAYDYLLKTYILEVVNTASKDAWETHLINAGWAYNPHAQNRGRHSASRANVSKDMDFEVSGKPDEVEDLSDFEKELMRVKL